MNDVLLPTSLNATVEVMMYLDPNRTGEYKEYCCLCKTELRARYIVFFLNVKLLPHAPGKPSLMNLEAHRQCITYVYGRTKVRNAVKVRRAVKASNKARTY